MTEVREYLETSTSRAARLRCRPCTPNGSGTRRSPLAIDIARTPAPSPRSTTTTATASCGWFANRFHADYHVARLLAAQAADDHRQLKAVLRISEQVFGITGGIEHVRARRRPVTDPVSHAPLYDQLAAGTAAIPPKGTGFTVAIFISALALGTSHLEDEAKLAILIGSLTSAASPGP